MFLKKDVIWKRQKSGSMLYNTRTEEKMVLNDLATNIFLSVYVNHFEIADIAENYHTKYKDVEYDQLYNDVASCIRSINQSQFVTGDDQEMNFINLIDTPYSLDNIIFEITGRCNLDCRHCIEGGTKEQQELTKNEIFDLIDDFKMLGVYRLVLTGGEPFCRKELTEIIKRCSDNCIKTIVFTNGTLLTEEILEKIKNENVLLRFSVDGATKEVHDAIRGAGNFEKTVKAMEMCKAKNIDIGISSTINTLNYNQYKDIVELADSLKVRELELSEMICEGNGRVNDGLLLDAGQLEQLRVYNLELANHNNSFRKGMGFGKQAEAFQKPEERKYSCNAGITTCFIGSDGEIFPCTLFKEYEEFSAGNIRENSLYDIWTRQEAFHNLRHLDINTIEKCKKCDCFNLCPGGCRAKAFMATRDLAGDMDDIFCQISIKMRQRMKNGEFNYVWQG